MSKEIMEFISDDPLCVEDVKERISSCGSPGDFYDILQERLCQEELLKGNIEPVQAF
jgi:hypothetical protein